MSMWLGMELSAIGRHHIAVTAARS